MTRIFPLLLLILPCFSVLSEEPVSILIGDFQMPSKETLPSEWKEVTFPSISTHTHYALQTIGKETFVVAESKRGASMLGKEVAIDLARFPILSWSWRVEQTINESDLTKKKTDDAPARILVVFGKTLRRPTPAISYIWSSDKNRGKRFLSPYTRKICNIILQDQRTPLHQWQKEKRNVFEDYQSCFGEPSSKVSGVALLTDTDNTSQYARTWYGDIAFSKK